MKKIARSIRFDENTLKAAIELGLNINDVARRSVEAAVLEKSSVCPLCQGRLKKKKALDL